MFYSIISTQVIHCRLARISWKNLKT
jgi:hypothetical protein